MSAFHYIFRTKLVFRKEDEGFDFFEFEKNFENENPIKARRSAFKEYQNYLETFLEAKNSHYYSDKKARKDLESYFETNKTYIIDNNLFQNKDIYSLGIGVFMIIDVPKREIIEVLENEIGEELLIHGIGCGLFNEDFDFLMSNLETELEYYKTFKYEMYDDVIDVLYCDRGEWEEGYTENEPSICKILETPLDWSEFKDPYWWGEPDQDEKPGESFPEFFEEIIKKGENNQVEFKPALFYNYKTQQSGISVKNNIAKAICAFINSNGGYLFIGVDDHGNIQGLKDDFSLSNKPNTKDFFRLQFDDLITHFFTSSILSNIKADFYQKDDFEIFVVTVWPRKLYPTFLNGQYDKEFYIRGQASSLLLKEQKEIEKYCAEKWGTEWNSCE